MSPAIATGEAHGKIILLGEHAVVHGTQSVAMAFSRGARARASKEDAPFTLSVPAWNLSVRADDGSPNAEAVRALSDALGIGLDHTTVKVEVELPSRSGLGASASVAAAVARSLAALGGQAFSTHRLFDAVQASETVFHGTPSGLDAAVALHGGVLRFSKKSGPHRLELSPPPMVVVHSGSPGETRTTVARFADRLGSSPREAVRRIDRIDQIVAEGISALQRDDLTTLGSLMNENHEHLVWFGVSSPGLDRIVQLARDAGALGAKLTGGGGGGCAIVLAPGREKAISQRLEVAGFSVVNP